MKKLNPYIHYQNKTKTKHYYQDHIFTDEEWNKFIHGELVQNTKINISNPLRKCPAICDRWHKINDKVIQCVNKPIYKSNHNLYFCKDCAREVNNDFDNVIFVRIKEQLA